MGHTIEVSYETWKDLNARKEPGTSFDDVIQELIQHQDSQDDDGEGANGEPESPTAGAST